MALVFLTTNQTNASGYGYALAAAENTGIVINQGVLVGGTNGMQFTTNSNLTISITNYGSIYGQGSAIYESIAASNHRIYNHGTISGDVYSLDLYDGIDTVLNAGTLFGRVSLLGGNDVFDSRDGYVYGAVFGGNGNDTLTGGKSADSLYGDDGDDVINFSIEDAVVRGGNGYDIARNTYNDVGLTFDMGGSGIEAYYGSMAGETIRTSANVRMDVDAGGGNDLVIGSYVGDGISGGAGDDQIFGNGGPDNLAGGFGNDTIEGGAGADILTGEAGNDSFVFRGVDGANVDTITDFVIGEDKIQILRSGFLSPAQWGPGALDPARFVASANPSPINGTACFLFDNAGPGVGTLYWNDGSGSAQGLAVITTNNPLFFTAADFVLV